MSDSEQYLRMQQKFYNLEASKWSLEDKNPVVGFYDDHESHQDYDVFLFKDLDTRGKLALEYGCGPGRNLIRFAKRFERIDGVDISPVNLQKAKAHLESKGLPIPFLVPNRGDDIPFPDSSYDIVFSVICLQHICVHEIRFKIMSEIYRVLKPGGYFCAQMGFGGRPESVTYYDNHFTAAGTNGYCDVSIEDEQYLVKDLQTIGFHGYRSDLRPGCRTTHKAWLWFLAEK